MKTDDLIRILASDAKAEPPVWQGLLPGLPLALLLAFGAVVSFLGLRADLDAALRDPVSSMRFVLGLALGLAGLWAALLASRPVARRSGLLPLCLIAAVAGLLWLREWMNTPQEARAMAVQGKTMVSCLVSIPVLSILPVSAILVALRRGASVTPLASGAYAGLAGGGFAAALYAFHCTEDSPLFFVTWYGVAILIVTFATAALSRLALRW